MRNFLDFVTDQDQSEILPELKQVQAAANLTLAIRLQNITVSSAHLFSASSANELATQIGNAVYSRDFLKEFSDAIGNPFINETEEEFVHRCKTEMMSRLQEKFK